MIEQKQELESKVGKYKEENESLKETTNKLKQEV
jgi:cell division protein FtsB